MQRWGWEKCFPGSLTLPDRRARRACLGFYPEVSWMVYTAHPPRRQVGLSCSRPGPLFTLSGLNGILGSFRQRPQSPYFSFFTEVVSELKKFKPRILTPTDRKLETSPVTSLRIFHSPRATKLGITFLVLRDEVTAKQGRQKKGKESTWSWDHTSLWSLSQAATWQGRERGNPEPVLLFEEMPSR